MALTTRANTCQGLLESSCSCTGASHATSSHSTKPPGCSLKNKKTTYCGNPPKHTEPHTGTTAHRTGQHTGHRSQCRTLPRFWQHRQHSNAKRPQTGESQSKAIQHTGSRITRHRQVGPNPRQLRYTHQLGTARPTAPIPLGNTQLNGTPGRAIGAPAGTGMAMLGGAAAGVGLK